PMTEDKLRAVDFQAASRAFTDIYTNHVWGKGSGASSPAVTSAYMQLIQSFISNNAIKSVVDVGCGDWQFSQHLDWSGIRYDGFDVVDCVVKENQSRFGADNVAFHMLSGFAELPTADLVVCKDVLQHLPNADVRAYLNFFCENYKHAIITNDSQAVNKRDMSEIEVGPEYINIDIQYGQWRLIRPDLVPFNIKVAVLLRWSIDAPTMRWTKDACLLLGKSEFQPIPALRSFASARR